MQKEKMKFFCLYVMVLSLCVFVCSCTDLLWMNLLWLCKGFYGAFNLFLFIFSFGNSNSMVVAKFFVCIVIPLQVVVVYGFGCWFHKYTEEKTKKRYVIFGVLFVSVLALTIMKAQELSSFNVNYGQLR